MKTFNKKIIVRVISALLCVALAVPAVVFTKAPVSAQESLEELKNEYSELEKEVEKNEKKLAQVEKDIVTNEQKLETINGQIDAIKGQIEILDERIGLLDDSINELRPQISTLNGQIGDVQDSIKSLEGQIEEAQVLAADTEEALRQRIREDYMTGGNASMLEILLTADNLSSFLARLELMSRVSENDEKLIKDLEQKTKQLNELKEKAEVQKADLQLKKGLLDTKMSELNSNQNDLEDSRSAASSKKASLNNKYAEVNEIISELDEDSEAYRKQIAKQRQEMEILSKQIDNYIEENGSAKGEEVDEAIQAVRTSNSLIWPVPYQNTGITCHYGYYSDGSRHWGTDIVVRDSNGSNISNGKDVVAAQSGKVILAVNDGGYNYGYGNYCIIDHGDGLMTLYCHCKRIVVSEGQIVRQGQKIAEIGLTGNTTGYHLHFEVRIKNADGSVSRVNPENYVSP